MKKTKKKVHTLKVLNAQIKQYKKDVYLTWGMVFMETILEIMIAYFMSYLLESISNKDLGQLLIWCGVLALMAVGAAYFGIMAGYFASSASAGFGKNLRDEMFVKIQDYSFKNIDKFSPASIVT